MLEIEKEKLLKSIDKGLDFIQKNQKKNGSICLEEDSEWNIWETAIALEVFQSVGQNNNSCINDALDFLSSVQRRDGSYYYNESFQEDEYCMETTAVCINVLRKAGYNIDKGINFILGKQQYDGSWEIGNLHITKYRNFPSITGFVLRTLLSNNISLNHIEKGIKFLKQTQQDDGSWGNKWMYYDTPFYPIHVILKAFKLHGIEDSERYRKAVDFVKNIQNDDGSWCIDTRDRDKPSRELRTTLALDSLLVHPTEDTLNSIEKGVEWLIKNQQSDGRWDGGIFVGWSGKKEDIYATSMSINALKKYDDYIKLSNGNDIDMSR